MVSDKYGLSRSMNKRLEIQGRPLPDGYVLNAAKDLVQYDPELITQLRYVVRSCPCGARSESLTTHPHVLGCPIAKVIENADRLLSEAGASVPSEAQEKNSDTVASRGQAPPLNRLGIEGLHPVDPAVVREFERTMTEEVIPKTIEDIREREIAWDRIKDLPLTAWTPEYLVAKAEESALVVGLRANGEGTAADTIMKLRADFETEREMHNAWRKRAEEAEARERGQAPPQRETGAKP